METVCFNAFNVVSVQTESYLDLKKKWYDTNNKRFIK